MKKTAVLIGFATILSFGAFGQKTSGGYFDGAARALVTNNSLTDTASNNGRATGGYTMFDLGIHAVRKDVLKASATLRVRNEFGGFFGDGVSFDFRQIKLEGVVGKRVKYELGDLDVKLTPFTVFNSETDYHEFESELFGIKRDVLNYENFYTGENTWRMQGVNTFTTLNFDKGIEKLKIRFIGNRIGTTDRIAVPDRFLYGGRVDVIQSKNFQIGLNVANVQDLRKTVEKSKFNYSNQAYTVDININKDLNDDMNLGVSGEFGQSILDITQVGTAANGKDSIVELTDGFVDAGLNFEYKPIGLKARVGYRSVGANYNSPTAQTRRILLNNTFNTPYATPGLTVPVSLYHRLSQETGLYNSQVTTGGLTPTRINTVLMAYNPVFNNSTPYGVATPNRAGIYADVVLEDTAGLYKVRAKYENLSERVAENGAGKRSYSVITVGGKLGLNQILDIDNAIVLHGSARIENTTRSGNGNNTNVDLNSLLLDVGLDVEVAKRFHALVGLKSLNADGNEYSLSRDEFNKVNNSTLPTVVPKSTWKDQMIAVGVKYIFTENAFINAQYNSTNYKFEPENGAKQEFTLANFYVVYNQKF